MEKTVTINGMKCDGCVTIVKEKFGAISGVTAVDVNLEQKQAAITSDQEVTTSALQQALAETKFEIVE